MALPLFGHGEGSVRKEPVHSMGHAIKFQAAPDDGEYDAALKSVEQRTSKKTGNEYFHWRFEIPLDDGDAEVSGFTSTKTTPKSQFYRWVHNLLGAVEEVDLDALMNMPVRVQLETDPETNDQRVVNVLAPRRKLKPTMAPVDGAMPF